MKNNKLLYLVIVIVALAFIVVSSIHQNRLDTIINNLKSSGQIKELIYQEKFDNHYVVVYQDDDPDEVKAIVIKKGLLATVVYPNTVSVITKDSSRAQDIDDKTYMAFSYYSEHPREYLALISALDDDVKDIAIKGQKMSKFNYLNQDYFVYLGNGEFELTDILIND